MIVADLEAGIGTLTRLPEGSVDTTLVVVEPTPRSIDVGQRAVVVATERHQGGITVVANKVTDADDDERIRAAFADHEIVVVPTDPVISRADRRGVSPLDVDADTPAVVAIAELAAQLGSA